VGIDQTPLDGLAQIQTVECSPPLVGIPHEELCRIVPKSERPELVVDVFWLFPMKPMPALLVRNPVLVIHIFLAVVLSDAQIAAPVRRSATIATGKSSGCC
jgi:hypothetical protein